MKTFFLVCALALPAPRWRDWTALEFFIRTVDPAYEIVLVRRDEKPYPLSDYQATPFAVSGLVVWLKRGS